MTISTHAPRAGSDRHRRQVRHDIPISTHAPRAGSDGPATDPYVIIGGFQPTLPVRGATRRRWRARSSSSHFNPRSPCGERPSRHGFLPTISSFQPTLPVRGATHRARAVQGDVHISTHAPRAGSDASCSCRSRRRSHFNPRSPCGERRQQAQAYCRYGQFQPTLPVRGATKVLDQVERDDLISTHAPRAGSDVATVALVLDAELVISTHAPRAGSDENCQPLLPFTMIFQPTLPVRGATALTVAQATS